MDPTSGVSRKIPAKRRWKILELANELSSWPVDGRINARQNKTGTQMSYVGQAGYRSVTAPNDSDFDDYLNSFDRVSLAHREIALMRASAYQERIACDWDEATNTFTDEEAPMHPWKFLVTDGIRYGVDEGRIGKSDAKGLDDLATLGSSFQEYDISWTSAANGQIDVSVSLERDTVWLRQIKHKTEKTYFSFGRSVHYLRISQSSFPAVAAQTIIGRPALELIDHPLIGPGDIIASTKLSPLLGGSVIINLDGIRQLFAPPPITSKEECLHEISEWQRRGFKP